MAEDAKTLSSFTVPVNEQLNVYSYNGGFVPGVRRLNQLGLSIITAEDLAELRVRAGLKSKLSTSEAWVGEGYICLPDKEFLVVSRENNPIFHNLERAAQTNYDRQYYVHDSIVKTLREKAESDPEKAIKTGVFLFKRFFPEDDFPQAESFGETPITIFLFRKYAKAYGELLKERGLDSIVHFYNGSPHGEGSCNRCARGLFIHGIYPPVKNEDNMTIQRYLSSELFALEVGCGGNTALTTDYIHGVQRVSGQ